MKGIKIIDYQQTLPRQLCYIGHIGAIVHLGFAVTVTVRHQGLGQGLVQGFRGRHEAGLDQAPPPGGGGVQRGSSLSEHLGVSCQDDPGQKSDQRDVADYQEHLQYCYSQC